MGGPVVATPVRLPRSYRPGSPHRVVPVVLRRERWWRHPDGCCCCWPRHHHHPAGFRLDAAAAGDRRGVAAAGAAGGEDGEGLDARIPAGVGDAGAAGDGGEDNIRASMASEWECGAVDGGKALR